MMGAMASILPRNGFFYLKFKTAAGLWRRRKLPIRIDDPEAKRKCAMALAQEQVREAGMVPSGSAGAAMRGWKWVPDYLVRHYTHPESLARARNVWAAVSVFLDCRRVSEPGMVTAAMGHDYVAWRQAPPPGTVKARTKNTALTELKIWGGIQQHAVVLGLAPWNPLYRLGIKRDRPAVKPEIDLDVQKEIEAKLAESKPQWMNDAWLVAMKQGCRLDQICLPLRNIDLANNCITFPEQKGKTHTATLHPDLLPLIERRRAEGATLLVEYPKSASSKWSKFFNQDLALGIPHLCFHSTRVTVITRLLRDGWTVAQVMQYVGHSSQEVNEIYRRLKSADVAKLTKSL